MSRNMMPGLGKSGTARILFLISVTDMAVTFFYNREKQGGALPAGLYAGIWFVPSRPVRVSSRCRRQRSIQNPGSRAFGAVSKLCKFCGRSLCAIFRRVLKYAPVLSGFRDLQSGGRRGAFWARDQGTTGRCDPEKHSAVWQKQADVIIVNSDIVNSARQQRDFSGRLVPSLIPVIRVSRLATPF